MAAGDVSVRGRRRERDVSEENGVVTPPPTVKRRKLEEEVNIESRIIFSPCVQATSCGGILARNSAGASETSVVFVRRRDSSVDEKCQIPSLVSCCSSNRSEEKTKRRIEFVDLEVRALSSSFSLIIFLFSRIYVLSFLPSSGR